MTKRKKYWNIFIIFIVTISIITVSSLVYSQEKESNNQGKDEPAALENKVAEAVTLGNEVVFYIKDPIGDYSAQERAEKISEKLKAIAESSAINVDDLEITEQEKTSIILLRYPLVTLTEQDAISEGKDLKKLGEDYLKKIKLATDKYRIKRSRLASFVTLLTLFILFLIIIAPFYFSNLQVFISGGREWYGSFWQWITKLFNKLIVLFNNLIVLFKNLIPFLKTENNPPEQREFSEEFLQQYKVGELNKSGELIEYIYESTDDYIIYRTNKLVRWLFDKKNDVELKYEEKINKIIKDLAYIECNSPEQVGRVETINRLTAKGIKLALQDDYKSAKEVLYRAKERLESFRKIDAKLQYLIASLYSANAIIFLILFSILLPTFFREYIIDIFSEFSIPGNFMVAISCGALGGFLSVASGISRLEIDPDSDVMIAGMSRIFIAVISSVIIYIGLRANLLPDLSKLLLNAESQQVDAWRVGFISAAAGFTESFVPNILKNLPNQRTSNQQQQPARKANQGEGGE